MEVVETRGVAIEKLCRLSAEEVSKVLVFMVGLEAGAGLSRNTYQEKVKGDPSGTSCHLP